MLLCGPIPHVPDLTFTLENRAPNLFSNLLRRSEPQGRPDRVYGDLGDRSQPCIPHQLPYHVTRQVRRYLRAALGIGDPQQTIVLHRIDGRLGQLFKLAAVLHKEMDEGIFTIGLIG